MLNIKIDNTVYKCKTELSEFSLKKTRLIHKLALEDNADKKEIISECSNIPDDILINMEDKDIDDLYDRLDFLKRYMMYKVPEFFKLKDKTYKIYNFDDFTVKDIANIQLNLMLGNQFDHLHNIISYLIRPINIKSRKNILYNKLNNILYSNVIPQKIKKYEWIDYNEDEVAELFDKHLDAGIAYTVFYQFTEWQTNLQKEYPDLFKIIDYSEYSEEDVKSVKEYNKKLSRLDSYGIYANVCDICNSIQEGDIWWTRNIRELYKYLSYKMVVAENEKKNNK